VGGYPGILETVGSEHYMACSSDLSCLLQEDKIVKSPEGLIVLDDNVAFTEETSLSHGHPNPGCRAIDSLLS